MIGRFERFLSGLLRNDHGGWQSLGGLSGASRSRVFGVGAFANVGFLVCRCGLSRGVICFVRNNAHTKILPEKPTRVRS